MDKKEVVKEIEMKEVVKKDTLFIWPPGCNCTQAAYTP